MKNVYVITISFAIIATLFTAFHDNANGQYNPGVRRWAPITGAEAEARAKALREASEDEPVTKAISACQADVLTDKKREECMKKIQECEKNPGSDRHCDDYGPGGKQAGWRTMGKAFTAKWSKRVAQGTATESTEQGAAAERVNQADIVSRTAKSGGDLQAIKAGIEAVARGRHIAILQEKTELKELVANLQQAQKQFNTATNGTAEEKKAAADKLKEAKDAFSKAIASAKKKDY